MMKKKRKQVSKCTLVQPRKRHLISRSTSIEIYLFAMKFHDETRMPLMAKSTGKKSPYVFGSQYIVFSTPLPAAISKPTGPFRLSVHPGMGSYRIGTIIDGRMITAGIFAICSTTTASDRHLVNAYVFGK